MARRELGSGDWGYWIERNILGVAEFFTRNATSGVQVMNQLRQRFKGLSMKFAGQALSQSVKAIKQATLSTFGDMKVAPNIESIPINPRLFPEGRMGRRVEYRVILTFTDPSTKEKIYRTVFVQSPNSLSPDRVQELALQQSNSILSQSPGAAGKDTELTSFVVTADQRSVWRSH